MNSSKGMKIVDENFPPTLQNSGSGWKIIDICNLLWMRSSKKMKFWMQFSTSTLNSGSGWKIINRHNQLWIKSSKEMKFVDENVHFHSKFWVWMKHNQRKQTNSGWNHQKEMKLVDENVHFHSKFWVWMKHNQHKQTNSGWNHQKEMKFVDENVHFHSKFWVKYIWCKQTNSGCNHQKRWNFWMKMCHSWMKKKTRETSQLRHQHPYVTSTYFYVT